MEKMVEDILLSKKNKNSDVVKKNKSVSSILKKNINTIKKLADKEGVDIKELIKILKGE